MKKDIKPFCVEILLCFLILCKRWYSNIHNLKYAYLEDVFGKLFSKSSLSNFSALLKMTNCILTNSEKRSKTKTYHFEIFFRRENVNRRWS